jgi:hypothetical protein
MSAANPTNGDDLPLLFSTGELQVDPKCLLLVDQDCNKKEARLIIFSGRSEPFHSQGKRELVNLRDYTGLTLDIAMEGMSFVVLISLNCTCSSKGS